MVVLAGGIGSGKSYVARILRLKGFGVFDCDYEAKLLMATDQELKNEIKKVAGDDVYSEEGNLDREMLGRRLFSDLDVRKGVNRAVHARVRDKIGDWLDRDDGNIFVETAIAAESGIAFLAKEVWFVDAPLEERIRRIGKRDSRSEEEIIRIMEVQKEEELRLKQSGVPIVTIKNGDTDSLLPQIDSLLKELITENLKI